MFNEGSSTINNNRGNLLSRRQLSTIGYSSEQQIPSYLWNANLHNIFDPIKLEPDQAQSNLYNQTFAKFSSKRQSGRQKFSDIGKIRFGFIPKQQHLLPKQFKKSRSYTSNKFMKQLEQRHRLQQHSIQYITSILQSFFTIPVQYFQTELYISKHYSIVDEREGIQYGGGDKQSYNVFDIEGLIGFGTKYHTNLQKRVFSKTQKLQKSFNSSQTSKKRDILLLLIEADMIEQGSEIDGRAIGNGVAFITYSSGDFLLETSQDRKVGSFCYTLSVLIHQCLHTLGYGHCSAWKCLMNSITNEELWLCPGCLRKVQSQLPDNFQILQWYQQIVKTLQEIQQKSIQRYGFNQELRCLKPFINKILNEKGLEEQNSGNYQSMLEKGELILKQL